MDQKPSVGRIVHYVSPRSVRPKAAIVVDVREVDGKELVDLTIFPECIGILGVYPKAEVKKGDDYWEWPPRA